MLQLYSDKTLLSRRQIHAYPVRATFLNLFYNRRIHHIRY
jgi:hypothetical protein